jgi:hypothetical protein
MKNKALPWRYAFKQSYIFLSLIYSNYLMFYHTVLQDEDSFEMPYIDMPCPDEEKCSNKCDQKATVICFDCPGNPRLCSTCEAHFHSNTMWSTHSRELIAIPYRIRRQLDNQSTRDDKLRGIIYCFVFIYLKFLFLCVTYVMIMCHLCGS